MSWETWIYILGAFFINKNTGENITYMGYVFLSSWCPEWIANDNARAYAWIEHVNNMGGSTKCQASPDSPSHLCLSCSLKKEINTWWASHILSQMQNVYVWRGDLKFRINVNILWDNSKIIPLQRVEFGSFLAAEEYSMWGLWCYLHKFSLASYYDFQILAIVDKIEASIVA